VENMKRGAKTLFELSMEEKKKLWQREADLEGFGQAFILSEEQKLEWADAFFLKTLPSHSRNPHIFNQIPQTFRSSIYLLSFFNLFHDFLCSFCPLITILKMLRKFKYT